MKNMVPINEEKIKTDWKSRRFSVDIWVDPPGQVWADFKHDADELFMLLEGQVTLEISNQLLHPQIGQEILIPANTPHTVKNVGSTESRWLYGYKRR